MKKTFVVLAAVSLFFAQADAQYYYDRSKNPDKKIIEKTGRDFDTFYFLSWDNNTPLSNTNFVSSTSYLGTKLGFRKRLNDVDRLWAGADFGWGVYKEYFPFNTYTFGSRSLSTDLYDYVYSYNLSASIDYFIFPMEKHVTPYGGLNIGAAYDKFAQYYNVYGGASGSWGVLIRPEIGVLIGIKENASWRIKAAFHYDYSSNSNSDFGYKNFTNIGFQIGLVKMAW
ncbi:MAG: hypothetical protein HYR67_14025 [Bacteroidetes bacterium]|nr:hypothetical protein [Bacteroidota bacterium]